MSEANVMYMQECGIKLMSVPTPRGVHFPRPTSRGQVNLGSGLLAYSVGGEGQGREQAGDRPPAWRTSD